MREFFPRYLTLTVILVKVEVKKGAGEVQLFLQ